MVDSEGQLVVKYQYDAWGQPISTGGNGKEVVRRIDGIDKVNRIIYELKPNNPRAIARGWKQLDQYANMLGGEWTQVLVLY